MHILERPAALAELNEIARQWQIGVLTNAEYHSEFARIDAAHSHDLWCANGDHRRAALIVGGKLLCGVCALKEREARG